MDSQNEKHQIRYSKWKQEIDGWTQWMKHWTFETRERRRRRRRGDLGLGFGKYLKIVLRDSDLEKKRGKWKREQWEKQQLPTDKKESEMRAFFL